MPAWHRGHELSIIHAWDSFPDMVQYESSKVACSGIGYVAHVRQVGAKPFLDQCSYPILPMEGCDAKSDATGVASQ